ncbi:flagellar biosynthesis protein FlgL [Novosphingobium sp. TH158]|uniref:flagellin N-terminal helical domain-containing protein n=1 Tax=Novosphingobium sp. TH158 TaxID=2067455 RepID=UPI000C796758|nr:flagellar biosynthesis protein FlgL [Novosphingobium sp. TH158]PLK27643.1 flagellar biosynthesis protein FlgL [Novosphingobium sp. TH158]
MTIVNTSTSAFYDRSLMSLQGLRAEAEELQANLASGQRLATSADDPVASSRLRQLARSNALSTIDTANAQRATSDLQLTDGALSSFAGYVTRVKELALQASTGTLTAAQRSSIGAEIAAIRQNVIGLANSRDATGHALFGGEAAGGAYVTDALGNATYIGTNSAGELPLGDGQTVSRGLTGPEFLTFAAAGGPQDLMAVMKTLGDALQGGSADPQAAAHDSLDLLDAGLEKISTAQSVVGSRLAWIELTNERRIDMNEMRAGEEAEVGGTDIAATVAKLQQTMTVLEASQASFAKLAQLSLFDVLR